MPFVFFPQQSEDAKAQEASKKEFQETENLKNLFCECKVFLSREVPREILVFVFRYDFCIYTSLGVAKYGYLSEFLKKKTPRH